MKKKLLFFLIMLPLAITAQNTFQYAYDLDELAGPMQFKCIIPLIDGGFAVAGTVAHTAWSQTDSSGNEVLTYTNDLFLMKTDASFNTVWSQVYHSLIDFTYQEAGVKVKQKLDGGFVLLAEVQDPQGIYYNGSPAVLISADLYGNVLWSKSFSATTGYDKPFDFVIDHVDNSIIVAGSSNFAGTKKPWAFKTNSSGTVLWDYTYTNTTGELRSIFKSTQGGYIIAGRRGDDAMLMNLNASGANIWTKTFSTASVEYAQDAVQTTAGYAVLNNNISTGSMQLQFVDNNGASISARTYAQLTGVALSISGNELSVVASQGSNSIVSFNTGLTGVINTSVKKYSINTLQLLPEDACISGNDLLVAGHTSGQGYIIRQDNLTMSAGGCYDESITVTSQSSSFTVASISPSLNNLTMEIDVEALMCGEPVYINKYIVCSCPYVIAKVTPEDEAAFCTGGNVLLSAEQQSGYLYEWLIDGVSVGNTTPFISAGVAGSYEVVITSACGQVTSHPVIVSEDLQPVITSFTPDSGAFGDTITVFGEHLDPVTAAYFGSAGTVEPVNDTTLKIIIPANASSIPFTLETRGGCTVQAASPVSVLPNPVLSIGLFIEALYQPPLYTITDSVLIEVHDFTSPSTVVFSQKTVFDSQGDAEIDLPQFLYGGKYYIALKHRNSIETWFKNDFIIQSYQRLVLYN